MSKICFASFEIHPTTKGGMGVLLFNLARQLLLDDHQVVFVLDIPEDEFDLFEKRHLSQFPHSENCRAYQVNKLCADIPYQRDNFVSLFVWNSYRFHFACSKVAKLEMPNVIEFFDYSGIAYIALSAKLSGIDYLKSHLAIRLHTSNEVMDVNEPRRVDFEYFTQYDLEHHSLRIAETILYPSLAFLQASYLPYYPEKWFGKQIEARPPLLEHPNRNVIVPSPDIILFYGRLHTLKGAELFVRACVAALQSGSLNEYRFYLVGHDSMHSTDGVEGESYQNHLWRLIPKTHQDKFVFTGALTWSRLEEILPRVQFAVFPNYYESFCYSLHELYAAGLPLTISDLPAFQDYFEHNVNALIFDGGLDDLVEKMVCLAEDSSLRTRLSYPGPVVENIIPDFYKSQNHTSWLQPSQVTKNLALQICIIDDTGTNDEAVNRTVSAICNTGEQGMLKEQVIILKALTGENNHLIAFNWLGNTYTFHNQAGAPIRPDSIYTAEALLILHAGDLPHPNFIKLGKAALARHPEISYVGCWKEILDGDVSRVNTFPVDAMPELVPFIDAQPLNRCIMRTVPGYHLTDLFDYRSGIYGELQYIWKLNTDSICGIVIPEVLLKQRKDDLRPISPSIQAYLVLQDCSSVRKSRLAKLLLVWYCRDGNNVSAASEFLCDDFSSRSVLYKLRKKTRVFLETNLIARKILLKPMVWVWEKYKNRRG